MRRTVNPNYAKLRRQAYKEQLGSTGDQLDVLWKALEKLSIDSKTSLDSEAQAALNTIKEIKRSIPRT